MCQLFLLGAAGDAHFWAHLILWLYMTDRNLCHCCLKTFFFHVHWSWYCFSHLPHFFPALWRANVFQQIWKTSLPKWLWEGPLVPHTPTQCSFSSWFSKFFFFIYLFIQNKCLFFLQMSFGTYHSYVVFLFLTTDGIVFSTHFSLKSQLTIFSIKSKRSRIFVMQILWEQSNSSISGYGGQADSAQPAIYSPVKAKSRVEAQGLGMWAARVWWDRW